MKPPEGPHPTDWVGALCMKGRNMHGATYCFRCRACGAETTSPSRDIPVHDCETGTPDVIRDYRAERVGIGSGVRESHRELTTSGYRDLFLPTAEDFADADDPSGQKGLRNWAETHGPRESNKRPAWPEMDRKVFATS